MGGWIWFEHLRDYGHVWEFGSASKLLCRMIGMWSSTFFRTKQFVTWSPAREFYHLPVCTLYPGAWHFNIMIWSRRYRTPWQCTIIAPFGASATDSPRPQVCSFVGNPWLLRMFFFFGYLEYGSFLTWWYPKNTPQIIIFNRKTCGCWVPPV